MVGLQTTCIVVQTGYPLEQARINHRSAILRQIKRFRCAANLCDRVAMRRLIDYADCTEQAVVGTLRVKFPPAFLGFLGGVSLRVLFETTGYGRRR